MRATLRYIYDEIAIPPDSKLGDKFTVTATAVVTGIEDELIDVTGYGNKEQLVPGGRSATITFGSVKVEPA